MNYKPYTKKELALQYFPDSNPRTAVGHLMSWIRRCTPLWDELQQTGYTIPPAKPSRPDKSAPSLNTSENRSFLGGN